MLLDNYVQMIQPTDAEKKTTSMLTFIIDKKTSEEIKDVSLVELSLAEFVETTIPMFEAEKNPKHKLTRSPVDADWDGIRLILFLREKFQLPSEVQDYFDVID